MKAQCWKSNFAITVISILFTLVVVELGIRVYDAARGRGFFTDHRNVIADALKPLIPFRIFGFKPYKVNEGEKYISSRHGELYPIKKPQGTFRIVVFGGSTSENMTSYRDAGIHYPLVLQEQLRQSLGTDAIEVINVASAGYSTAHSLILFELDTLSWDPDLIIVSHNINDLLAAYWPDFTFDYSNKYANEFYMMPVPRTAYTTLNFLLQHSQLYWVIHKQLSKISSAKDMEIRRRRYSEGEIVLPRSVFERNLRSFIAMAKHNGITVLLGNQALYTSEEYFVSHMSTNRYNSIVEYPMHGEFVQHHRLYNESIKRVADKEEVLFLDNDSALGEEKEYFIDFIHYTPTGVKELASNYARFLLERSIIRLSREG